MEVTAARPDHHHEPAAVAEGLAGKLHVELGWRRPAAGHVGAALGDVETLDSLLAESTTPTDFDRPLLLVATQYDQVASVELLLSRGADVGEADRTGRTVLHDAASRGNLELMRLFLDHGADPDAAMAPDLYVGANWRPLNQAARSGSLEAVRLLLEAGADAGADAGWQTALVFAAGHDDRAMVDLLLDHGARATTELSGGERQRVALGRVLLADPQLLLMDEPLAAIDAGLRAQILPYLRWVHERLGIPILYVSHSLPEILELTDRLVLLDRGAVLGHGEVFEVLGASLRVDGNLGAATILPVVVENLHEEGDFVGRGSVTKR